MDLLRREFFKLAGIGTLALAAAPQIALANTARNTDTLVVIYLRGGLDGLAAVAPYTETEYYSRRPTLAVPRPGQANGAIDLDGRYGLHPALAPLKRHWDSGTLGVVHAVGLTTPSRSHFDAQDFMERAWMQQGGIGTGWLNRHLQQTASATDPTFRAVAIGRAVPRSNAGAAPVVALTTPGSYQLTASTMRGPQLSAAVQQAFIGPTSLDSAGGRVFGAISELAGNPAVNAAPDNGASYPNTAFGGYLRTLAALIKAGVGVEAATADIGGWDSHRNQAADLNRLLDELARALDAFVTDLGPRMAGVSVVTMTEFGRKAFENASQGTDHGRGSVMFALGGGVVGKQVMTDWPTLREDALDGGDLRVTLDYRAVLAEWLSKRGGAASVDAVFPGFAGRASNSLFRAR